ncbi:M56 family metallopeptidase [Zhouia spongiae]|uniref:M56 family metallopeptidase n=1 Tax=Zhouia spongiae TaxID=2202721 RepID=A0ABY3YNL8_9FLAO|nr:M56 family metallopeptidase [Zhouia spongiae]UNY99427.1 M56 family metallopeptidase [Zhouia spongiae]
MLHYIIQTISFQLLFLLVYDLFLKKETFFNGNRVYLIVAPLLSLVVPFIRLESFKGVVPQEYAMRLPVMIPGETTVTGTPEQTALLPDLLWWQWMLVTGSLLSILWFGYKLIKIYQLRQQGKIHRYKEYTEVLLTQSEVAFSFFRHIFLGDYIKQKNHDHIIAHELVHIRQGHTWDLMLFEILRIVFWFNPLIYIYQARISELHEFIADDHTAKRSKKQSYELLLEQVFNTEHISFINQFFNHSLIKKRIVMLQKTRSKKIWQLKYLLMVPLVAGMLVYTSCEKERKEELLPENTVINKEEIPFTLVAQKPMFTACEDVAKEDQLNCFKEQLDAHVRKNFRYPEEAQEKGIQGRVYVQFRINVDGSVSMMNKRGPDKILEDEAIRIIEALPRLIPGKDKDGNAISVAFAYPIVFRLN